jgi:hypothetical protein
MCERYISNLSAEYLGGKHHNPNTPLRLAIKDLNRAYPVISGG